MRGTGVAAPHVEIDPPAVLFGVVSDDAVAVVTVTNTGQIDLELAEVAVEAPFSVYSSGDWPTSLEPGQHIELEVGLAGAPSGTAEGTLRILTDDPTLPMAQVPIKGYIADSAVVESAYPAVASAEGLGGARWRSTAILLNPGLGDIVTDVRFMPPGGPSSGSPGVTISIPPGHQRVLSDVVGRTGNHGTGGLDLTTSGAGLVATSRTYAGDDSGTYGQLVPAVPDQDALVGGETYLLAGLVANGGFHTNFGVLNLGEDSISVDFDVHDAEGRPLGTVHLSAAGNGFAQRTSALSTLTGDEIRGGFASVSCANSAARYLAYASSVDDNSHDPTLVSPQVLGRPVSLDAVIPVVASTSGIGGTLWRSHATVVNTGAGDAAVELEFYPRDGGEVTSVTLGVGPGRALFLADVVGETFAATGSGWVSVTSEATGVHVASRTFNNDPAGTYGQNVPAVDADDLFGAGDTVVLAGLSSIGGFRTNVGIASRSAGETRFVLRANRDDGELIGELALTVPAAALLQVERVLGDGFGYSGSAWITLVSDDAQAEFAAYASVVDGSTGDSTFVPGVEIGAGSQR
jgi:hypothetical protein